MIRVGADTGAAVDSGTWNNPRPRFGGLRLPAAALLALLALGLLGGCSSKVVRTSGANPAPKASTPKPGASVVVRRGDTLYRLAVNNGISPMDLALWNGVSPPYTIHPGQRLRLYPGGSGAARTSSVQPAGTAQRPVVRPTQAPPQPSAPPPASSRLGWRWPTDGQVLNRFAAGDATRQGIGIVGRSGQPVRAAADGVVVYSGSGLVGYGELVIVKHDEQWLSAYGHNRTRLVNEGTRVSAGQQIAEMGSTGAAREMLHFEIRYNGKPVDPLQHLPRR
jgi:lipoprotein NlpD